MEYKIEKTGESWTVFLPPLHWSESDGVWFSGSHAECAQKVRDWKKLQTEIANASVLDGTVR